MFKDILIGQYFAAPSPIHRLDPRTKIVLTFVYVVILFFIVEFEGFIVAGGFTAGVVALSQVPLGLVLRSLRPVLFLIALTVTIHALVTGGPDAEVVWQWGRLSITDEGLRTGAFMGIRLGLLIMTSSLLTLTTSPIQLTDGLERLMKPTARVGVPAHELAMMMTIALRFIPTLLEEADKIMKAQMARGAEFASGGLMQRVRALIPILVPLFVSAFRRADELALAMEARCYRGGEGRTRYKVLYLTGRDVSAALVTLVFVLVVLWMRFG
ncbi:MAG: energy-coupling factor transporter transmembrane component T [Thermaerobacterales bacterium]